MALGESGELMTRELLVAEHVPQERDIAEALRNIDHAGSHQAPRIEDGDDRSASRLERRSALHLALTHGFPPPTTAAVLATETRKIYAYD